MAKPGSADPPPRASPPNASEIWEVAAEARADELAAARRSGVRRRQIRLGVAGAAGAGTHATAGGLIALDLPDDDPAPAQEIRGLLIFEPVSGHVSKPVEYARTPLAGGEHNPACLNCGVYNKSVFNETAVHSLEHGAVWITYRPDLPASAITTLTAAMPDSFGILSPYPDLPSLVAVSVWGRQRDGPDDHRLNRFISEFRPSPVAPEPSAPCHGGIGDAGNASRAQ